MKFIRSYQLFESFEAETRDILRNICFNITDNYRFEIGFGQKRSGEYYMYICLANDLDHDGFIIDEVIEVIERIKRFLGDRYKSCGGTLIGDEERYSLQSILDKDTPIHFFEQEVKISDISIEYS